MINTSGTVLSKSGQYIINRVQSVDVKNKTVLNKTTFIQTKDLDNETVKDIVDNPDKWTITNS